MHVYSSELFFIFSYKNTIFQNNTTAFLIEKNAIFYGSSREKKQIYLYFVSDAFISVLGPVLGYSPSQNKSLPSTLPFHSLTVGLSKLGLSQSTLFYQACQDFFSSHWRWTPLLKATHTFVRQMTRRQNINSSLEVFLPLCTQYREPRGCF